jgi:hypothetical protein
MGLRSDSMTGLDFQGEFWEYRPWNFGEEEQGNKDWPSQNGTLPYIPSKSPLTLPPLPQTLQNLMEHAWTAVNPSEGAIRSAMPAGSHRTALPQLPPGKMPPLPSTPYQKLNVPPTRGAAYGTQAKLAPHLKTAFAQDWSEHKNLERVRAFAFRGDTRAPTEIKKAGGFHPPISRTDDDYLVKTVYPQFSKWLKDKAGSEITEDEFKEIVKKTAPDSTTKSALWQYGLWRSLVEAEQFHLGRMVAEEALKGFISTTRAVTVAKAYADKGAGGWVYVLLVTGGYLIPDKTKHKWTEIFGEQEIALAGSVPWDDVMGFRQVEPNEKKFTGRIYLRKTFDRQESDAAEQCYKLLSGRKQP